MFATKRVRLAAAALTVALLSGGIAAAATSAASASPRPATKPAPQHRHPTVSLNRFDLNGYVIDAKYTLGRNTGSTFQQTYTDTTVVGVPVAGPYVGQTFPAADYVALPIGNDQIYITWIDPKTDALTDVFVFNFKNHTVYDYAPGSLKPESAGYITVVAKGGQHLPR